MRVSVLRGGRGRGRRAANGPAPGRRRGPRARRGRRRLRFRRALLRARPDRRLTRGPPARARSRALGRGRSPSAPASPRSRSGSASSLEPGVPCRSCAQCLAGRYNLCPDVQLLRHAPLRRRLRRVRRRAGGLRATRPGQCQRRRGGAARTAVRGRLGLPARQVSARTSVLVTGAGPIGLVCAQAARAFGATQVWVSDVNRAPARRCRTLGAIAVDVPTPDRCSTGWSRTSCWSARGTRGRPGRPSSPSPGRPRRPGRAWGATTLPIPLPYVQDRELVLLGRLPLRQHLAHRDPLVASGRVDLDSWSPDTSASTTSSRR